MNLSPLVLKFPPLKEVSDVPRHDNKRLVVWSTRCVKIGREHCHQSSLRMVAIYKQGCRQSIDWERVLHREAARPFGERIQIKFVGRLHGNSFSLSRQLTDSTPVDGSSQLLPLQGR